MPADEREAAFRAWLGHFRGSPPYINWGGYDEQQIHCIREALRVAYEAGWDAARRPAAGERDAP